MPLGPASGGKGPGAGDQPGEHILEVEVTLDELAKILGEELELPRIEPKGKSNVVEQKDKYTGISQTGPESLRHFKRTYKRALKRQILAGQYDFVRPKVVPMRSDQQYRSWKPVRNPETNAVVFYMMDISGSMGEEQKEVVRTEAFWIDTWLQSQYDGVETCYIVHDVNAREVDQEAFYRTRESGGTMISSAYSLCRQTIESRFPPADWNIYSFHFTDGDNWGEDNSRCKAVLRDDLLPTVNLFCYGQVYSPYGSGSFVNDIKALAEGRDNLVWSEIRGRESIMDSIKLFLGRGK